MDSFKIIIGENLKRLRRKNKLSLEGAANLTGVSKSMIAQIERGEVNPTVSIVWKLANGFRISFTELMNRPETTIEIINKNETNQLIEDHGKYRNYPLFPFDPKRRFEMYTIEIDPSGQLDASPHPHETQEFITVFSGHLTLSVNDETFYLSAGDSIRFKADSIHTYHNPGDDLCQLSMVIYYPE